MVYAWARIITCTECDDTGCVDVNGLDACPACTRRAEQLWQARRGDAAKPEMRTTARRPFDPAKFQRRA